MKHYFTPLPDDVVLAAQEFVQSLRSALRARA